MDGAIIRTVLLVAVVGLWALVRCLRKQGRPAPASPGGTSLAVMSQAAAKARRDGDGIVRAETALAAAGGARHAGVEAGNKERNMDATRMTLTQIRGYLEGRGCRFAVEEEKGIIRTGYQMPKVTTHVVIAVTHGGSLLQLVVTHDLIVPEKLRAAMAETVVRANFGLTIGRFDFDMSDGCLTFHASVPLSEAGISEQQFDILMAASLQTVNRYHRAFCRLVYGDDLSPAEVIAEVEMAEAGGNGRQDGNER